MHVLAIDAGSYSVKYISSFLDKRHAAHVAMEEFVLSQAMLENPSWESEEEATFQIIKRIVDDVARQDTRIVLHVPPGGVTTRFLTLPIKNRKKAEMMIPFQLEEDIPYALHESHFGWSLETGRNQSLALVALTRDSEFATFHDRVAQIEPPVSTVTSEPSVMDAFYFINQMAGAYCVLDVGHRSTKAYFFYNSKLIATHVSYVGGRDVDQMVAQTYTLPLTEAVAYKHQNAFVLTTGQNSEVDENQREFARLMDQVFRPLVADFQRWELGFRVTHGIKVSQVFLCGGSANIKNIGNYLTEKFAIKCSLLETFEGVDVTKIDLNTKARAKFTLVNMMTLSQRAKGRLINLLTGRYATASRGELPVHSMAFITTRAIAVTAVLALALIIEGVMLNLDLQAMNTKLTTLSKNAELGLNAKDRRMLVPTPKLALANMSKKQRAISQQISSLQAASDIKALSPLVAISSAVAGTNAMLVEFNVTDAGEITAIFEATEAPVLAEIKGRLEALTLNDIDVESEGDTRLKLTAVQ